MPSKRKPVLKIDFNVWQTQKEAAEGIITRSGKPATFQYITRLIATGKLETWHIPQLNITLIKRKK